MVPGMMNSSSRTVLRNAQSSVRHLRSTGARFVSTQPPHLRSRSWKSSALRWGIAGAGIYYYNTSPVFAEQPHHNLLNPNVDGPNESEETSALEELISRRSKDVEKTREELAADASIGHSPDVPLDGSQGAAALEEEAQGEGAFNPETGEINWDCPCLGGMAHGPCGPQFREAFSCFVYSKEEPKGMDCIEKFQGMRDCFQEHPEVYKDELMEDEELDAELEAEKQDLVNQIAERRQAEEAASGRGHRLLEEPVPASKSSKPSRKDDSTPPSKPSQRGAETASSKPTDTAAEHLPPTTNSTPTPKTSTRPETGDKDAEGQDSSVHRPVSPPPVSQAASSESDELLPKAAHDARDSVGPRGQPPKKE